MRSYKVSATTKAALIEAAGELIAEYGTESVTLEAIARRAGTVVNAINYHFGSKAALINAVWDHVLANWQLEKLYSYYNGNAHLFNSPEGRRQLVVDLIDILFKMIYPESGQPIWMNIFILRSAMIGRDRDRIGDAIFRPVSDLFCEIYRRITGSDDHEGARCWVMQIVSAPGFFSVNATTIERLEPEERMNSTLYRRLQYMTIRNALRGVGLSDL